MKNSINRSRTLFTMLVLWVSTTAYASAQHMHMAGMSGMAGMPGMDNKKNVFIAMMDTMMMKMDKVPKGQSAARTFVDQMMPHHEGAISMANYEIKHGKNFDMIQLAKSIKAEQQSELQQMKILLAQLSTKETVPPHFDQDMDKSMEVMMDHMPAEKSLKDTDHAFARVMLPHHQAAVDMARALLKYPVNNQVAAFARQLISNEQIEIEQMSTYLHK